MRFALPPASFARVVAGVLSLRAATLPFGIAAGVVVARALGVQGKGIVELALLIPGTLDVLLNGGLGVSHAYFAGSGKMRVRELMENAIAFALAAGVFGLGLVWLGVEAGVAAALFPGLPRAAPMVASLALPLFFLNRYLEGIAQGIGRIRTVFAVRLLEAMAIVAALVSTVVLRPGGAIAAIAGYVIGTVVTAIVYILVLQREGGTLRPRFRRRVVTRTLEFGLRGHAANVLHFANYRLDMFVVMFFHGPTAVGLYSVAVRVAELLWHLADAVGFALFPRAAGRSAEEMNRFTPRAFRTTLLLTFCGAMVLAVLGGPLITLLYSETFAGAYAPLLALLPGVVLLGGGKVLTNDIAGRGYPQYNSVNAGFALAGTLVLDLLLVPTYGIIGAGVASSLVYGLVLVVALVQHRYVAVKTLRRS